MLEFNFFPHNGFGKFFIFLNVTVVFIHNHRRAFGNNYIVDTVNHTAVEIFLQIFDTGIFRQAKIKQSFGFAANNIRNFAAVQLGNMNGINPLVSRNGAVLRIVGINFANIAEDFYHHFIGINSFPRG